MITLLLAGKSFSLSSDPEDDLHLSLKSDAHLSHVAHPRKSHITSTPLKRKKEKPEDKDAPLFVEADKIEGETESQLTATGDVELKKADTLLYADKLIYQVTDKTVDARGSVRYLTTGMLLDAPYLHANLSEDTGSAVDADYRFSREVQSRFYQNQQILQTIATNQVTVNSGAPLAIYVPDHYGLPTRAPEETRILESSGHAAEVEFQGKDIIKLKEASYSTCAAPEKDWWLKSSSVNLDFEKNEGTASNSVLWFKGVPIFYAPTFSFPVKNERKTGALTPTYTSSTKTGFDFTLPYYVNLAPNYDLTLYPRYMSKRGFQLGAEARYLERDWRTELKGELLPKDQVTDSRRYAFSVQHAQQFGQKISANIDYRRVSDAFYFQDLSSRLLDTSQALLPQQLQINYYPSNASSGNIRYIRYQTLQFTNSPLARPYFIEPQINISHYRPNVLNSDFYFQGQYSRFTHPDNTSGDRFVFYPQLTKTFFDSAFQITPKAGLHMTHYQLRDQSIFDRQAGFEKKINRALPILSVDSTVFFERTTELIGKNYIQTLEPRLYYVYIPYKDQKHIPLFDTGLTDFNFAQIFSENRYVGADRINDANQITGAITTRFLGEDTGVEYFKAAIGQRYYFSPQKVKISEAETERTYNLSNTVASLTGLVAPKTYAEMSVEYNNRDVQTDRFSLGLRFQPDYGRVLSASYRYSRDPISNKPIINQIDLAGQWSLGDISPIFKRWYAVGRYNHSVRDKKLLEGIAGLEYNAGCWAVRFVAQRLQALAGAANTSIFLQLELNDFASIGSSPVQLLRRSVPGYGKTNELTNTSDLLPP